MRISKLRKQLSQILYIIGNWFAMPNKPTVFLHWLSRKVDPDDQSRAIVTYYMRNVR